MNNGLEQAEQIIFEIKKLFDNKIIEREGDKFVLDYDSLILESPEVENALLSNPLDTINILNKEICDRFGKHYLLTFKNLSYQENISDIRVEHLGKIVKVEGMISNASTISLKTIASIWECPSCGGILNNNKNADMPKSCSCGRKGMFKLIREEYENSQDLVIEENQDEIGDRSPKRVRVRLINELCDKEFNGIVKDGNKVEIIGVVEAIPMKIDNLTKEKHSYFRIHALQIKSLENDFDETITDEDIEEIERISLNNPLEKLANSLNPGIIGRENEKKALILSAIGAYPKKNKKGVDRGRINVLLIGDASTGKTQLLQAMHRKHFKSIYTGCERMTEASLIGGAEKDELTGIWSLKAGIIPKANKGLLILDEFDKMSQSIQKNLHTPMESGVAPINIIGRNVLLNADDTFICGANPKNSRFDPLKPLPPQINMSDTLMSRFTLIIAMRDFIEEEKDRREIRSIWDQDLDEEEKLEYIEDNLFRKYLKYAQKFDPKITEGAKRLIENFYVNIRKNTQESKNVGKAIPIVMRQGIGIDRLAQASARCRLSNEITEEDAKIAINLYSYSLKQLGMNEEQGFDFAHLGPGVPIKVKEKRESIYDFIKKGTKQKGFILTDELNEFLNSIDVDFLEGDKLIKSLKDEGIIFNPKNGVYKSI